MKATEESNKGNKVGAWIERGHAFTDAAGAFEGPGTIVSLLGDALAIGLHWATKR